MMPIEILAVVFAVVVLVKLLVIIVNPKAWMKVAGPILRTRITAIVVYLALAVIIGHYIFETLDILEVAAVMLFTSILIGLGVIPYSEIMLKAAEEMLGTRKDVLRRSWLAILVWGTIAIWVLCAVFA